MPIRKTFWFSSTCVILVLIAFSMTPRRWSMRDDFSFCECSKWPTLSPSSETVGASWLIAAKRRSNCCWLLVVSLAVLMTLPLSLALLVLFATWFSSLLVKVGPGFGSTPAINSMSSSVVTANRAASPSTRNPLSSGCDRCFFFFFFFFCVCVCVCVLFFFFFSPEHLAEFRQTTERLLDRLRGKLVCEIFRNHIFWRAMKTFHFQLP